MANYKPKGAPKGNQYAKGRIMPEGLIAQRRLTRVRLEEILQKYLSTPLTELRELIKNPGDTPSIELIIVSILAKSISTGDQHRLEFLLNRILGKIPDKVEFEDKTDHAEIERLKNEYKKIFNKPE